MKKEIKNLSIEERISESGLFDFCDGYLGSTCHGVGYYYGWDDYDIDKISNENELENLVLNKEYFKETESNWDGFFDDWFSDCNDYEIIEDGVNGGKGYGKIIIDKINKNIKIMVVPCLYSNEWGKADSLDDTKIFGFDWETGKLVREINKNELREIIENKNYYIS
jgi:hypothetical protein